MVLSRVCLKGARQAIPAFYPIRYTAIYWSKLNIELT